MERITSRKNPLLVKIRKLAAGSGRDRREAGEYLGDGVKLLEEALKWRAPLTTVVVSEEVEPPDLPRETRAVQVPRDVMETISPMNAPQGALFLASLPNTALPERLEGGRYLILDGLQDPGNVGTVLRTANALGVDVVALLGNCADLWHPKTVRATMGAVFRQRTLVADLAGLLDFLEAQDLPLYGAALSPEARDVRRVDLRRACVAVGSEGQGLSRELLGRCQGQVILPMEPGSESMNAAVAAALLMWQMCR